MTKFTCGCCDVELQPTLRDDGSVSANHPDNGCAGASAIRIPDEVIDELKRQAVAVEQSA